VVKCKFTCEQMRVVGCFCFLVCLFVWTTPHNHDPHTVYTSELILASYSCKDRRLT